MALDWDAAYASGDTPWDKGEASPPLRAFLRRHRVSGDILVPGCGTGHDARLLAASAPEASVLGLDLAPRAIAAAEAWPRAGGERYREGDFLELPGDLAGAFDWVFEHTLLCAIAPESRRAYAKAAARALRPGGNFLAVFFRHVPGFDGEGPPYPIGAGEIAALFHPMFEPVERWTPERTYAGRPPGCEEVAWFRARSA